MFTISTYNLIWLTESTPCSKKGCPQTHGGNFCQISTNFQNSFTTGKGRKFPINMYIISHHTLSMLCCRTTFGIQKFTFVMKLPNKIKTRIIFVSFIHMAECILLLSHSCSNCPTFARTHAPWCAKTPTQLINCIVNDALVHSMPNVQQTLLLLFMIYNCLNTYH